MEFDSKQFIRSLDNELRDFIELMTKRGLKLTLVGGGVRDFLLYNKIVCDLDFEVRPFNELDKPWVDFLKNSLHDFEALEYHVYRKRLKNYEVELSSPRIENFNDKLDHKNFDCDFDSNLNYQESFQRRDFSLNAMGIEISSTEGELSCKFIDPYKGLDFLAENKIEAISTNFSKDPVRFLRLIRFSLNLKLNYGEFTNSQIEKFNLSELSLYYFFSEYFKCKNNSRYFKVFFELVESYDLACSKKILDLKKLELVDSNFEDSTELLVHIAKSTIEEEFYMKVVKALNLPLKKFKNIFELVELSTDKKIKSYKLIDTDKKLEELINDSAFTEWHSFFSKANSLKEELKLKVDQSVFVKNIERNEEVLKLRENYSDQKSLWRYFDSYLALRDWVKNS